MVVRDKGIYSIIDSARGRIFTYDHEGNLLYIFGGLGTQQGTFDVPTGIDAAGDEILVIDSAKNIIDKFKATEYGSLINEAIGLRYDGDEIKAVEKWKGVQGTRLRFTQYSQPKVRQGNGRNIPITRDIPIYFTT